MPLRRGGGKNERKVSEHRAEEARRREAEARNKLKELCKLPVNQRPAEYTGMLRAQEGILKQAIAASRKSEEHSRQPKGGKK